MNFVFYRIEYIVVTEKTGYQFFCNVFQSPDILMPITRQQNFKMGTNWNKLQMTF